MAISVAGLRRALAVVLVVTFVGLAILTAGIAGELGVSDGIGAFMIALVLAALAATHSARIGRLLPSRAVGSQVESQPRA